ncbi:N-dimethylarginine dimethylaminohydrolase [Sediminihabitans luteus]|uniref:N-dimethylarginine dimethylaminohydrolase n=1 Tax=Sediminihabitans luteus TaxID=1138585 RepID=A0A2M9CDY5_9CELL|nr:dimethylargininase [Sediminihabitans luteus]PJJ70141.1 N-dimethylarginine dimethylaminohydrolase [Sediminihabitans luteus]GIJ00558.1 amidinotransferase [Sediminihabitans luteus]
MTRRYLMCRPTYFTVSYQINPWMDTSRPVDTARAISQWERLRDVHRDLGHEVVLIEPLTGLPDMVYAANGATVVDGTAYSALFKHPERAAEGPAYLAWFAEHDFATREARHINEGEGDLLLAGDRILAGYGFRSERSSHAEIASLWHREVVSLELVDPRFYHLDTALTVLRGDDGAGPDQTPVDVAYYPEAFSPESRARLEALFPDALRATEADAVVLGLNSVSDGEHVVINPAATDYAGALRDRGYEPVPVDTSELLLGGGGAKCCTLVLRS